MARRNFTALTRIFYMLFALCFGWVLVCSIFANVVYPRYSVPSSLLLSALFALLFWLIYRFLFCHAHFCARWGWWLCAAAVLGTATIQVVNGLAMRYSPVYDLWAVYGGGMAWAQNGTITNDSYFMSYFHMFPSNVGGAYLFRLLFSAMKLFGGNDHYTAALILNVLLLQGALITSFDVLRRMGGYAAGVLGLLVFAVFPPFYMMGPVFYTDCLSILPPILVVDFYLMARAQKAPGKRLALHTAMGIICAFGAIVKFTVVIALLAVLMANFVSQSHFMQQYFVKATIIPSIFALVALVAVMGAFQLFVQNRTLDKARLEKEAMPFSHWVAMGLIGDGGYDEADYDRAMKLPSRTARNEVNRQLIFTRLTQPGPVNLAKLFTRKAVRCFGDGTYDLSIFLDDGPHRRAAAHELALMDGKYYALYSQISQGFHLAMLALALLPAVKAALWPKKGARALRNPAPWLCLFGLLLFLMMWETNSRYTLNYMPVLAVCAALGAAWLRPPHSRAQKIRIPQKEKAGAK